MRYLERFLDALLWATAGWTVAYHVAMATGMPFRWIGPAALVLVVAVAALSRRLPGAVPRAGPRDVRVLLACLPVMLAAGVITTEFSRPDNDDFSFFHRALCQLERPDEPVITRGTAFEREEVPALSTLHVMTSYEPFVAYAAWAFGIDPLTAYHVAAPLIASAAMVAVLVLLYRRMGVPPFWAVGCAAGVVAFLLADGNTHRSFGNMALVRLWQGKTILWMVVIPYALLATWRFCARPSRRGFLGLSMAGISAVGLSNAGVFMYPLAVGAASAAWWLGRRRGPVRWRRAAAATASTWYAVGVGAALVAGVIERPADVSSWIDGWPAGWVANLYLVVGDWLGAVRNLALLAVPVVVLRRPFGLRILRLAAVLVALCVNPLAGPAWMSVIYPASYWRLLYLFPIPWCAGLVVWGVARRRRPAAAWLTRAGASLLAVALTAAAYRASPLSESNTTVRKGTFEYRFRGPDLAFARLAGPKLAGRHVLAAEDVAVVLALIEPSARFESVRPIATLHQFRNGGEENEGIRRVLAQQVVFGGARTTTHVRAFSDALRGGVDAVVTRVELRDHLGALLASSGPDWTEAARDGRYVLFLKRRGPAAGARAAPARR